jgi:hypothetical protein
MFQQQKIDRSQLQQPDELRSTSKDVVSGELTVDELFADPIMSALWRAHRLTEHDVRRAVADATARLKSRSLARKAPLSRQLACA